MTTHANLTQMNAAPTTTAFVLSGGGSLGAVQVGMLQALSRRGVQPDLLVGTSAGAVNAVWVAQHGMSPDSLAELATVWEQLRRRDIFPVRATDLLRCFLGHNSAISSSGPLGEMVRSHSRVDDLTEATIPVHTLATDLLSGRGTLISAGSPSDAVSASAAIPGIFHPCGWTTTGASTGLWAPLPASPMPRGWAPPRSTSCPLACPARSPTRRAQHWAWQCTPCPC